MGGKGKCQHIERCAEVTTVTVAPQRVVGTGIGVGTTFSFHALDSVAGHRSTFVADPRATARQAATNHQYHQWNCAAYNIRQHSSIPTVEHQPICASSEVDSWTEQMGGSEGTMTGGGDTTTTTPTKVRKTWRWHLRSPPGTGSGMGGRPSAVGTICCF